MSEGPLYPAGAALGFTVALVLATAPRPAVAEPPVGASTDPLTLTIAAALREHPELAALRAELAARQESVPHAGRLPDPRLSLDVFIEPIETRNGPQEERLAISQAIPWRGTLGARVQDAEHSALAAARRVEAKEREIRLEVQSLWAEMFRLVRTTALVEENLAVLSRLEATARSRYRVAAASHPDVIRAQIEIGRLEDRQRALESRRPVLAARLNALLSREPHAPVPWPDDLHDERLAVEAEQLYAWLERENPNLRGRDEEARAARARVTEITRGLNPDLMVGLAWTRVGEPPLPSAGGGDDALAVMVAVDLPIWRGGDRRALAREAGAADATAARRLAEADRLAADLAEALFAHDDAIRRIDLHRRSLIPLVTESLKASIYGFATGEADFLDLLDSERTLLELQLELDDARADLFVALARIDALVGRDAPRETLAAKEER